MDETHPKVSDETHAARDDETSRLSGPDWAANRLCEAHDGEDVSLRPAPGMAGSSRRVFQRARELKPDDLPMQKAAASGVEMLDSELDIVLESGKTLTLRGSSGAIATRLEGTVLVVEDEELLRRALRKHLEWMGLQVLDARDGLEALEVYQRHQQEITLVLLDYKMPKLDGAETLKQLRKIAPHVRVIFSSAYSEEEALEAHGALGWARFIQKPYNPKDLKTMLEELLPRPREPTP